MIALSGCGSKKQEQETVVTPAPTATPTAVPVTATPAPTATPTPRRIGKKTSQSKFIYLTNSLGIDVRELYLMNSGTDDWGDNLIPSETSIKTSEQVQLFYTPGEADTETGEETASEEAVYDMKLVTAEGASYEIYSIEFSDMEKAVLSLDQDTSAAYLRYMSLSEKKEKDTQEGERQSNAYAYDDSDDSYDSTSDDTSYDSTDNSDSGNDSSDSGSDGTSGNSGSDSSDDGSSDVGSYDDGSYDDGSYDDGSGDDYVDAGGGEDDGYYDTNEE